METLLYQKQWLASTEHLQVFIAGLSFLLAGRYPERVSGAIVMSTPTHFAGGWQVKALPLARYVVKWFYPLAMLNFNSSRQ